MSFGFADPCPTSHIAKRGTKKKCAHTSGHRWEPTLIRKWRKCVSSQKSLGLERPSDP